MQIDGTAASVPEDSPGTEPYVGWQGATEDSSLSPPSLPPLPAEEADLVGHHALLELVLSCH